MSKGGVTVMVGGGNRGGKRVCGKERGVRVLFVHYQVMNTRCKLTLPPGTHRRRGSGFSPGN